MYDDFVNDFEGTALKFEQVPFNHPMFIMYSSGTTGTPKCMVHSVGVGEKYLVMYIMYCVTCDCMCTGNTDSAFKRAYSPRQHDQ